MELSRRYFKRLDLSLLTTFEAFQLMPEKTLARFTELPGIKAIYRNYARFGDTTVENAATELNGVPIFRAILDGRASRLPRRRIFVAVPPTLPGKSGSLPRQASRVPARVADELARRHARAGGSRKGARAGLRRGASRPSSRPLLLGKTRLDYSQEQMSDGNAQKKPPEKLCPRGAKDTTLFRERLDAPQPPLPLLGARAARSGVRR